MPQRAMTYRVVPLASREAAEAPAGITINERLVMVRDQGGPDDR